MAEYCLSCHGATVDGRCLVPNCPALRPSEEITQRCGDCGARWDGIAPEPAVCHPETGHIWIDEPRLISAHHLGLRPNDAPSVGEPELNSPPFRPASIAELAERGYERVNAPRHPEPVGEKSREWRLAHALRLIVNDSLQGKLTAAHGAILNARKLLDEQCSDNPMPAGPDTCCWDRIEDPGTPGDESDPSAPYVCTLSKGHPGEVHEHREEDEVLARWVVLHDGVRRFVTYVFTDTDEYRRFLGATGNDLDYANTRAEHQLMSAVVLAAEAIRPMKRISDIERSRLHVTLWSALDDLAMWRRDNRTDSPIVVATSGRTCSRLPNPHPKCCFSCPNPRP